MDYLHEEQDLGKVYDARLMKRLLAYARPYRKLIALCVVLLLAIAVIDLARPYLIKVAIDNHILGFGQRAQEGGELSAEQLQALRDQDIGAIIRLGWILFAIMTAGFVLNYVQVYLLQFTGQRIVYDIRQHIFAHMQGLALAFFDGNPVGRLVTRVTNDTENLLEMYTAVLVNLFKDIFMLVGIVVVMFRMNARLAWVVLSVMPVIIVVTVVFRIKARQAYRDVRTKLAKINAFIAENISGMRLVQIFRQERRKLQEFDDVNTEHLQASMREMKVYAVFRPAMELIGSLAMALLIWVGAGDVIRGITEFGTLFAMINYLEMFFRPINDLTEKYNIMQSAMASAERIFQILDTEPGIKEPDVAQRIPRVTGRIEFKNIWFAYVGEEWVLQDISFVIEPGETAAFVGATGAGKSTIMNLITRFYDVQRGQILLDGVDIREIPKAELRRNIGLVMQDVFLFSGTIRDNIRLGNKGITDERIEEIARYVNAHHFIEQLPGKYDEPVMERGATLSAGQRQLLAFARALAFDPAVLILDEATANIDTETEQLIQEALPRLLAGRTSIVVAHRLSTIQHADKIIVLHKGRIREMGTHQALLAQRGLYYNLFLLQYKEDFHDVPTSS
jgi:ATP-binding cassette subfamily B multidrug efflux pump